MREPTWRQDGEEPDYRFSLANERTFLAWIRTALALLAGGVLLDQFSTRLHPRWAVLVLAIALCVLAALLCGMAYALARQRDRDAPRQTVAVHDGHAVARGQRARRGRRHRHAAVGSVKYCKP